MFPCFYLVSVFLCLWIPTAINFDKIFSYFCFVCGFVFTVIQMLVLLGMINQWLNYLVPDLDILLQERWRSSRYVEEGRKETGEKKGRVFWRNVASIFHSDLFFSFQVPFLSLSHFYPLLIFPAFTHLLLSPFCLSLNLSYKLNISKLCPNSLSFKLGPLFAF